MRYSRGSFTLFDNKNTYYHNDSIYGWIKKQKELSYKFLLAIMNSKLLFFYAKEKTVPLEGDYPEYAFKKIKNFPMKNIKSEHDKKIKNIIEKFVDYVVSMNELNKIDYKKQIDMFEETLDCLIYELYFNEYFAGKYKFSILNKLSKISENGNNDIIDNAFNVYSLLNNDKEIQEIIVNIKDFIQKKLNC